MLIFAPNGFFPPGEDFNVEREMAKQIWSNIVKDEMESSDKMVQVLSGSFLRGIDLKTLPFKSCVMWKSFSNTAFIYVTKIHSKVEIQYCLIGKKDWVSGNEIVISFLFFFISSPGSLRYLSYSDVMYTLFICWHIYHFCKYVVFFISFWSSMWTRNLIVLRCIWQ